MGSSKGKITERLLQSLPNERREFIVKLIGSAAFTAPVMASFPLGAGKAAADAEALATDQETSKILFAVGDSVLRQESPSTNEGANPRLRVGAPPARRAVVSFDSEAVQNAWNAGAVAVHLRLTIANNHNDWGQGDDRTVDAHPLLEAFTEGNGRQLGLPRLEARRGSGPGVTWSSPEDPEVADGIAETTSSTWKAGGHFGAATAPPVVHANRQTGQVSWDVTEDVREGASAWILKVTAEQAESNPPLGWDNAFGGNVDYVSRDEPAPATEFSRPHLAFISRPAS